jgi:hypothetical protein
MDQYKQNMIKHHTFSDSRMTDAATKCVASALKFGCDSSVHFMPSHIEAKFKEDHAGILNQERGAGYWLWKPYFILKALNDADPLDIIVYTDAGVEFVADVNNLINEMDSDIMVFGNGWRHGDWCKGDVLLAMGAHDYVDHDQCQASCVILRVTDYAKKFVGEWLRWGCNPNSIDDSPSFTANCEGFREHRHDQAILTNLAIREGLTFNRWPAQYALRGNEKYNNKYGQVFLHLGLRNNGKRV